MKEETRTPKQIVVVGTNGTGKTTLVKKIVIDALKRGDRVLIVVPDDMEWNTVPFVHPRFTDRIGKYVGARKVVYFPGLLDVIRQRFRNGLVVFDDCRSYFKSSLDDTLHALLIRRRQQMMDVIAVAHGFTEVPPKFFTFATHYAIFKTKDNVDRRKNVIGDFEAFKRTVFEINQKAIEKPHYYEIIPA